MNISLARKYIESLYLDRCDIYEYQTVVSEDDFTTSMEKVLVHKNVPCKISYKSTGHASDSVADTTFEVTRLLINPEIVVRAGSCIVVTRNGTSKNYKNSGEPSIYFNHQEIDIELEDDRA